MTTKREVQDQVDAAAAAIDITITNYRSRCLSAGQQASMLADIKALVRKASPASVTQATDWLTTLANFAVAVAPEGGCPLATALTEGQVEAWGQRRIIDGANPHSVKSRKGVLRRMLRAQHDRPLDLFPSTKRGSRQDPLSVIDQVQLSIACLRSGLPAQRGYAAVFGTGLNEAELIGGRFETDGEWPVLVLASGNALAIPARMPGLKAVHGSTVFEGDWAEVKVLAEGLGIYLNPSVVKQTQRYLALFDDLSVADAIRRFSVTEEGVASIGSYLAARFDRTPEEVATYLRGPDKTDGAATAVTQPVLQNVVPYAPRKPYGHGAAGRSPGDGRRGGSQMTKRPSKAAARRRMQELRAEAAKYPEISAELDRYLQKFTPTSVSTEQWGRISATHYEIMRRAAYTSATTVRARAICLCAYLAWLDNVGEPLPAREAMAPDAIDQYVRRGLTEAAPRTQNQYASFLRKTSERAYPLDTAARLPVPGYDAVRPGYTEDEEAGIRRAVRGLWNQQQRRRMCGIVGLGGGAGIDPQDARYVYAKGIEQTELGVQVTVGGPRARTVIVRRAYEDLVLTAIEGLKPDELVLPQNRRKANVVGRIIESADIFGQLPPIDMRRLRTTWLGWVITQPIPLDIVLAAAGLKSARTIVDIIATLPTTADQGQLRDGGAR